MANECPKCQTHNTEDSSSVRIDMRNIGLNNLREEIMGKEVEEILKKSEKIRKSKLILIEIPAGIIFVSGCIMYITHFQKPMGSVEGLFSITLGLLFFIIAGVGKQNKVNLELIERIQKLETKNSNES